MKHFRVLIFSVLLIGLVTACGNTTNDNKSKPIDQNTNDVVDETPTSDEPTTSDADQDKIIQQMEKLNFTELELDVSYEGDKEYDAEIDRKENGHYKVELEDEINDIKLKDMEAFEHLYPILENLIIEKDATQEDVIEHVLNIFGLDNNYEKFDLDIQFDDGTEVEYKDKR